nr:hypothetical protein SEVIR_9G520100v2 [Setaria viridis]
MGTKMAAGNLPVVGLTPAAVPQVAAAREAEEALMRAWSRVSSVRPWTNQMYVVQTKGLSEFGLMCTSLPSSEMSQFTTRNKIPTIQYQR